MLRPLEQTKAEAVGSSTPVGCLETSSTSLLLLNKTDEAAAITAGDLLGSNHAL